MATQSPGGISSYSFQVRHLRRADLPTFWKVLALAVGNLERSTGLDEGAEAMFGQLSRRSVWALLWLSELVGRPFVEIFVAADANRVVATGTLLMLRQAGYVAGIATEAEFRGRGLASRILAAQRDATVHRHRAWLVLDVESENETAIRVYRRAGYHDAAKFTFFTRTGLPPSSGPGATETRLATSAELEEAARQLDASRPSEYREALPATARVLSHSELLVRGVRATPRTWVRPSPGGGLDVLRAYYAPRIQTAAYFPMPGRPDPSPEEVARLLDPATEWFRTFAPKRCLAVAPAPAGSLGAGLERAGFAAVASMTTMLCRAAPYRADGPG